MARLAQYEGCGVMPKDFISEVREFSAFVSNPALTPDAKRQAYGLIIKHASMLDPTDIGYAGAGVALKHALCTWFDAQHPSEESASAAAGGGKPQAK